MFVGRTYSLANVSSVAAFTQESKRVEFLLLAALMAGFGIVGIWREINACSVFGFSSTIACVVIAVLLNDMHFVRITAAGGETNALTSKDLAHIRSVVAAINRAIVERG